MSTLNDAKLTLIPSGYKSTKVYSVKPTNGDGDFTFARNGDASRLNPGLNIEQVSSNVPRINHYSGGCPSLLLENEAQNLITYSEDFSQWTNYSQGTGSSVIITQNNSISPDGQNNGTRIQCALNSGNTTSDRSYIKLGGFSGTPFDCTKSLYVKNNLNVEQTFFIGVNSVADRVTLQVSNEWQRLSVEGGVLNTEFRIGIIGDSLNSDSIDIDIFGCQLETGNLSSYIKSNTGSPTTRQKDQCYDAGNSDLFNITEGSYFIDIKPFSNSSFYNISLSDGSANNRISWQFQNNNTQVRVRIVSGSTPVMNEPESVNFGSRNKLCLTFKDNEFKTYINGSLVNTQTSGNIPTSLDRLSFAVYNATGNFFEGEVYSVKIYDYLLTETQAIELTT